MNGIENFLLRGRERRSRERRVRNVGAARRDEGRERERGGEEEGEEEERGGRR
jgi:hypothetical protein